MKNEEAYLDRHVINTLILAYAEEGVHIEESILKELKVIGPGYLPHLKCSEECRSFLDEFSTGLKEMQATGKGPEVYRTFIDLA